MKINVAYFNWLTKIVCNSDEYSNLSYKKLLTFLDSVEFKWALLLDENRAMDGIDLRYIFAHEKGYQNGVIDKYLDNKPCSVLEMLIALSYRVEHTIMDDDSYGNRTGQWFWGMIVNLGLGKMDDKNFDERKCYIIISKFLNRQYEPNGKGGLFTIEDTKYDMRDIEIWTQCMWYLNSIDN